MRCHCLAHGRRQCSDLADVFPKECQVVIEALKQVFDHDDEARDQQMSPAKRLAYHQSHSQPIMDELKRWLQKQFDDHLVEPNSSLGKAIFYMQGHWKTRMTVGQCKSKFTHADRKQTEKRYCKGKA